jgi:hypothetical protein
MRLRHVLLLCLVAMAKPGGKAIGQPRAEESGGGPPHAAMARPLVYHPANLPPELPAWFRRFDTNGDAQVSLKEWREGGSALSEFRRIDRNNDGFLTVEEVLRYYGIDTLKRAPADGPGTGGERLEPSAGARGGVAANRGGRPGRPPAAGGRGSGSRPRGARGVPRGG